MEPNLTDPQPRAEFAGRRLKRWCAETGIPVSTYYDLPAEKKPESVKVGAIRIITESPEEWLRRMKQQAT